RPAGDLQPGQHARARAGARGRGDRPLATRIEARRQVPPLRTERQALRPRLPPRAWALARAPRDRIPLTPAASSPDELRLLLLRSLPRAGPALALDARLAANAHRVDHGPDRRELPLLHRVDPLAPPHPALLERRRRLGGKAHRGTPTGLARAAAP